VNNESGVPANWSVGGLAGWATDVQRATTGEELGDFEVVRATPWSTVVRWVVDGRHVWGKAVCPGFASECSLLPLLAKKAPSRILAPIATNPADGWLLLPDGGETLEGLADATVWGDVMVGYADVQLSVAGDPTSLMSVGCHDLRPHAAVSRLETMMDEGQLPTDLSLVSGARGVADQIDLDLVPASVQHDDLQPNNVFADGRVFDWGDASLAHPFASLLTALLPSRPGSETEKIQVRDRYLTRFLEDAHSKTSSLAVLKQQADLAVKLAPIGRIDTWFRAPAAARAAYPEAIHRWFEHLVNTDWH